jgi:hypothetical protein
LKVGLQEQKLKRLLLCGQITRLTVKKEKLSHNYGVANVEVASFMFATNVV